MERSIRNARACSSQVSSMLGGPTCQPASWINLYAENQGPLAASSVRHPTEAFAKHGKEKHFQSTSMPIFGFHPRSTRSKFTGMLHNGIRKPRRAPPGATGNCGNMTSLNSSFSGKMKTTLRSRWHQVGITSACRCAAGETPSTECCPSTPS